MKSSTLKLKNYLIDEFLFEINRKDDLKNIAKSIFSNYGTHVITRATFGGRFEFHHTSSYSSNFSYSETTSTYSANASFSHAVGSASASFNTSTTENENSRSEISKESFVYRFIGGNASLNGDAATSNRDNTLQDNLPGKYQEWKQGLNEANYQFIEFTNGDQSFIPIWDFVEEPLKSAMKTYFDNEWAGSSE